MKKFISEFFLRGLMFSWMGPIILAIIYYVLDKTGVASEFSAKEVVTGIISITLMAFIAAGITAIYQNEKLPVVSSALIHAGVLYLDYLIMYLLNDWIPKNGTAIGIFSAVFAAGFALIWLIIYLCIRKQIEGINRLRSESD